MNTIPQQMNIGTVVARKDWTETLFSLCIKSEALNYTAGQFAKLGLIDESGELVRRAYSIVTHPKQYKRDNTLEFLIITDEKGRLSPLLNQLQVGDSIYVGNTAAGFMTLDEIPTPVTELWLMATGSASGPFISMLGDKQIENRFQRIVLVHAVRNREELTYTDEIRLLLEKNQEIRYVPIISREHVSGVLSGRIPDLLLSGELQAAAETSFHVDKSFVYLCGNPEMVKDTSQTLITLGLTKHLRKTPGNFGSENYW
ncbi:ferredoxin--NADP reductase [Vibrio sp. F74]|uniref:ferredoxin--NADP reductase n=1 Tax=Vibrio sp. F74 TaxID=700020 RepID=UPI0035F5F8B3